MKGFFSKALFIDVENRKVCEKIIREEILISTLGGKGLGTYLLMELTKEKIDPFGSENCIILTVGPATDSGIYGSCRYGLFSKSPLTGIYGESYSGGNLAIPISRTGYDAIVIKGKSASPIWLEISDNSVKFQKAEHLWGKETFETENALKKEVSGKNAGCMVIGPAGEKLVKFAVVKNDYWRSCGRCGMGAIFGSKKTKGIAFHGRKKRDFYDPKLIKKYNQEILAEWKTHPMTEFYRKFGTTMGVEALNRAGAFPTEYWSKGTCEGWEQISSKGLLEHCDVKPSYCRSCFLGCGNKSVVKSGRHKGLEIEGPEFETIYAFGGLCLINQIEEIIYLNDICDRIGIDTISSGNLCGLCIEASKRGRITEKIEYGDVDKIANLLFKIGYREGVGKFLSEGIKKASEELKMEEIAIHVKGMEPAGYDPRVLKGMGLAYSVSDRGACHLRSTFYKAELSGQIKPNQIEGKAELFIDYEDRCTLFDSLILCRFYRDIYTWDDLTKIIKMTTGEVLNKSDLRKLASRITNLTREFNIREGIRAHDDWLPKRFFGEKLPTGDCLTDVELKSMVREYYDMRGWNQEGIPLKRLEF